MPAEPPITFIPEPQTSAVPPSLRGHLELEPDGKRPDRWRVRVIPDGHPGAAPGWLLLTSADLRRLAQVLRRLTGFTPGGPQT
jgi:hypothetical protein